MQLESSATISGSCMTNGDILEQVRLFLPKYLSPGRQEDLWRELRSFPHNRTIYSDRHAEPDILQGDGWRGFVAINFHSREHKVVSGLVLSNSCDVSPGNRRALVPTVTFVPLMRVSRYMELLAEAGQTEQQRESVQETMRKQEVTSLMFLPAVHGVMDQSVANFNDVHAHPLDDFVARERSRLFRLSDFGFYLFLFKLSIHFTRMLEGVQR
jgi:hypothetical protein